MTRARNGGHTIQQTERGASKKGYNGSQDPREGRHTIQEGVQRESRKGTMEVKTLEKADTPSKKGYKGNQDPREGGTPRRTP